MAAFATKIFTPRVFLLILLGSLLSGCGASMGSGEEEEILTTLRLYESINRWGDLEELYAFLEPELVPETPPGNLQNIRVTGYEKKLSPTQSAPDTVTQVVIIEYINKNTQVLKKLTDRQIWHFDADKKVWRRTNPIPEFK